MGGMDFTHIKFISIRVANGTKIDQPLQQLASVNLRLVFASGCRLQHSDIKINIHLLTGQVRFVRSKCIIRSRNGMPLQCTPLWLTPGQCTVIRLQLKCIKIIMRTGYPLFMENILDKLIILQYLFPNIFLKKSSFNDLYPASSEV